MKRLGFLVFVFICIRIQAQPLVLTQSAYEPVIGDSSFYHALDSSLFSSPLPNGITGNACVWNYAALFSTAIKANATYVDPTTVAGATAYPGTTVVQKQGSLTNYFKSVTSPTTQTEMLGFNSSTLNLTFTNTAIVAKFPMAYNTTFTDNVAGTFNFSISGTFTGTTNTSADGTGTLILPNGFVLTNVLRVKSVQNLNLFPNGSPFPLGTAKQVIYNYFHASEKFPILNITYFNVTSVLLPEPIINAVVTGNSKSIIVGLKNEAEVLQSVVIYPNPAKDILLIQIPGFDESSKIRLFDSKGLMVLERNFDKKSNGLQAIQIAEFAKGVYSLNVTSEQGGFSKKILIE